MGKYMCVLVSAYRTVVLHAELVVRYTAEPGFSILSSQGKDTVPSPISSPHPMFTVHGFYELSSSIRFYSKNNMIPASAVIMVLIHINFLLV